MKRILCAAMVLVAVAWGGTCVHATDLAAPRQPYYKAPPAPVVPVTPPGMWDGPHVGLNFGYGPAIWDGSGFVGGRETPLNPKVSGLFGGFQAGYDKQIGSIVFGVEGDIEISGERGSIDTFIPGAAPVCRFDKKKCKVICSPGVAATNATSTYELPWFSTVRARAGVTFDRFLFYVTGGLAVAEAEYSVTATQGKVTTTLSDRRIKAGWTAGAGVEAALMANWSVKAEYLYLDLGSQTFLAQDPAFTVTNKVQDHLVRLGVNYRL
jgi:outer membrane immunogenic protein